MKHFLFLILSFSFFQFHAQNLTGPELLDKAIAYHDPNGNWDSFHGELKLKFTGPAMADRTSVITIDLFEDYFNLSWEQNGEQHFLEMGNGFCKVPNKSGEATEATSDSKECERTVMFKNYYTYLYGLPMKLKDPGTHIEPVVSKQSFKGKEYLVLKVTYDKEVGTDIWQFYFNPETYAMEVYQFFKSEDKSTGEYILLSGETEINGIKIPKDRAWYYNKDDAFLGTDMLLNK